jgi:hypothetical protein
VLVVAPVELRRGVLHLLRTAAELDRPRAEDDAEGRAHG